MRKPKNLKDVKVQQDGKLWGTNPFVCLGWEERSGLSCTLDGKFGPQDLEYILAKMKVLTKIMTDLKNA